MYSKRLRVVLAQQAASVLPRAWGPMREWSRASSPSMPGGTASQRGRLCLCFTGARRQSHGRHSYNWTADSLLHENIVAVVRGLLTEGSHEVGIEAGLGHLLQTDHGRQEHRAPPPIRLHTHTACRHSRRHRLRFRASMMQHQNVASDARTAGRRRKFSLAANTMCKELSRIRPRYPSLISALHAAQVLQPTTLNCRTQETHGCVRCS